MLNEVAQLTWGLGKAVEANDERKDAESKLWKLKNKGYKASQGILDYYQNALQRFNTQPTDSAQYKLASQQAKQGTVQGLSALKDRRLGGNVASLINNQNNLLLKASAQGEARKAQELSTLGNAAQAKAAEEHRAYNYNEVQPFERQYNLLAMKAGNSAAVQNAAIGNIFNAAGALETYYNNRDKTGSKSKSLIPNSIGNTGSNGYEPGSNYNYTFKQYGTPTGVNY